MATVLTVHIPTNRSTDCRLQLDDSKLPRPIRNPAENIALGCLLFSR
jgi:hypothetical protein